MSINLNSLFGNLNNNNSLASSFNFSDMASIRNGSYKKLMKSYYSNQKNTDNKTDNSSVVKPNKTYNSGILDTNSISALKKSADTLKDTAKSVGNKEVWEQTNGQYDRTKVTDAIKGFVKDYNDVIDKEANVSARNVNNSANWMKSLTNVMSKNLAKVGISVGADNKLTVNEDKLKDADMNSLKVMFSGNSSYANQIADKASSISSAAVNSTSLYNNNAAYTGALNSYYNYWV